MQMKRNLCTAIFTFSTVGCAAVFKGSTQTVSFRSDPPGASIEQNGRFLGDTPTNVELDRRGSLNLRISMAGYEDRYGSLQRNIDSGWFVADIGTCVVPVLLCIPLVIDGISGAWFDLDPVYKVKMMPSVTHGMN